MAMPHFSKIQKQAGNIMGPFAEKLLRQAQFPPSGSSGPKELRVLDNACGAGTVSDKIMEAATTPEQRADLHLTCADISDAMVDGMKQHAVTKGWKQVEAVKADAQDTKLPASSFSYIFFSFGPFLLPDPFAGLRECFRMLQSGGTLGITTWQDVPWVEDIRQALKASEIEFPQFPSNSAVIGSFSERDEVWDNVEDVTAHFKLHGFDHVQVENATNICRIETIEEVREMMPFTLFMAIDKHWKKDEVEKYGKLAGEVYIEYVQKKYTGGPVLWEWAAIIATGKKPE